MRENLTVADDPDAGRYVARVGGAIAAFAAYRREPDRTVFTHTEVDVEHRRRGIGAALVRGALDCERERGRDVEPRCSFVARIIRDHPDYAGLVPERYRQLLDR